MTVSLCRTPSLASLGITRLVGIITNRAQRRVGLLLSGQTGNANCLDVQGQQLPTGDAMFNLPAG